MVNRAETVRKFGRRIIFGLLAIGTTALLAGAAVPAESTARAAEPASFTVKITGHGRPMILIPGLASSGATWDGTVSHFKDHYTCYVLTLAGFAGVPPIKKPLLPTVREDLAAYIEQHHLEKPIVVGHSLGGNIVLNLAEHHPQLVGPLVIVDSLPFYAGAWFQVKTLDQAKPIIARMSADMAQETQGQYLAYAKSGAATKYMVTSPAKLREIEQWSVDSDMHTVNEATIELVSEDLRPGLSRITSPVLVLGTWIGLKQQVAAYHVNLTRADAVDVFRQQYANVAHLHFAMSDGARHFIMFDDPAWFYAHLQSFLADPAAATKSRGFGTAAGATKAGM